MHYRCITDDPEHDTPIQDSPQGSPPFHPCSTGGEFNVLYRSWRAVTVYKKKLQEIYSLVKEQKAMLCLSYNNLVQFNLRQ